MNGKPIYYWNTCVFIEVNQFHTFDGQRKRGLLRLSGNIAGHNLMICNPQVPNLMPKKSLLVETSG
jgi:hypothetical protein